MENKTAEDNREGKPDFEKLANEVWMTNSPPELFATIFGDKIWNDYVTPLQSRIKELEDQQRWIDADIQPPEQYQDCAFIVIDKKPDGEGDYHGRILGGAYQGNKHGYHEFTTPGHGWTATFWQPLPKSPLPSTEKH